MDYQRWSLPGPWLAGAFISAALALTSIAVAAKPTELTMREQLNQTYGRELVAYPFTAPDGECVADSLQVTGPGGATAVQLTDIEYWPGKQQYVKAGRAWFVVEGLKPLTTVPYTLAWSAKGAPAVATDLQVKPGKDQVEITTGSLGVRLLLGHAAPAQPVAAKAVPGPLQGIRFGAGAWAGGSALVGDTPVKGWTAELAAAGPVLARVVVTYTFADENEVKLTATVVAGDNTVRWEMTSREERPTVGVDFRLPAPPGLKQALLPKGYGQWARADRTREITPGPEPFFSLTPDSSVTGCFPELGPNLTLSAGANGPTLHLRTRDPGAWSPPVAPLTYGGFKLWELDNIPKMWELWRRKRLPVSYAADGMVTLRVNFTQGASKWWSGGGNPLVGDELDTIKDLVLDWPADPKRPHPRVFVDLPQLKEQWARGAADPELMKLLGSGATMPLLMKPAAQRTKGEVDQVVGTLRTQLALLGNFDVMRGGIWTIALYDALVDSDLLTPADRSLFRAQMAYLAYVMASPRCWGMESGYLSGNPNMSCSYTLSLGIAACALPDHPMAKAWADYATQWLDKWLTDEVGPNGEWIPEGSHYSYVSLEPMVSYALAARRAGYHDFTTDARLKKLLLYFAKFNTPRDLRRNNQRGIGCYGRGHNGDRMAVFGVAAPLFKDTDPALSRTLQWLWTENGYPMGMYDTRLGGCEPYQVDRRLPAAVPAWTSELFPNLGVILRAGFNTPHESFVIALMTTDSMRNLDIWTPGIGSISQWFGRGKPLSAAFTWGVGYNDRHEFLRDGVRLARNWGAPEDSIVPFGQYTKTAFGTFAALPQADYVRSTFTNIRVDDRKWQPEKLPAFPKVKAATGTTLEWTRQLLFVKDADPAGPAYLVLRDTTVGGQPTSWQFWTFSEKLGTAEQARNAAAFLADKPGQTIVPARELPVSDRYTALGQFEMDVEYFVASPANTPRHTVRYGGTWSNTQIPDYQDLLHLQLPGDGAYCVVIYPRPRAEAAPTFAKFADGAVLKTTGGFGTDYAFLAHAETTATAEGVSFKGTAGAVQQRPGGSVLSLMAAGEVKFKESGLTGPVAAALRVQAAALELALPPDSAGGEFTITAPAGWKLKDAPAGVKVENAGGAYRVTVPKGVAQVQFAR